MIDVKKLKRGDEVWGLEDGYAGVFKCRYLATIPTALLRGNLIFDDCIKCDSFEKRDEFVIMNKKVFHTEVEARSACDAINKSINQILEG